MMNKFKNIFITTVLMLFATNIAFAENYILLSNEPITKVECSTGGVISVRPLTSLMNEKKTLLVCPIKDGVGEFSIKLKYRTLDYKAIVKDGKIEFKGNRFLKIVPLDLPPEILPQNEDCK